MYHLPTIAKIWLPDVIRLGGQNFIETPEGTWTFTEESIQKLNLFITGWWRRDIRLPEKPKQPLIRISIANKWPLLYDIIEVYLETYNNVHCLVGEKDVPGVLFEPAV
jgi:hypothetical protein